MKSMSIVSEMSLDNFGEMMAASPRKVREILYSKFGVKSEKRSLSKFSVQAKSDRIRKLHEAFKMKSGKQEEEVCQELIRNWLYLKRPMLKSALDFLEVPNENGLIDFEPDFFKELPDQKVKALISHLTKEFEAGQVKVYLQFMGVPNQTTEVQ